MIEAKVARVLNTTDVALNKGSDAGVEVGMRFAILSDKGEDIRDPDTKEVLDSIQIAKTLVKIVSVTPRLSVGRTFRTIESVGFNRMLFGETKRHESLRSDESRVQQELDPNESLVKVGDKAVQYVGERFPGIVYEF
ncbi:hypothetical protein [Agromyces larvae]|uniref:Uncharacterized protein n=1 Tax=Agromyces larvae TaxID=2929802 RepID=A0ABY4BV49_9MICO|nr:hypothetical protein [Agromyces larvae]UOE43087.1 hypothetical protein MTO99_12920 [Agromyces larvae]